MDADILRMGIMHQKVILSDSVLPDCDNPEAKAVKHETLVPVLAKYHLLTMTQYDCPVRTEFPV